MRVSLPVPIWLVRHTGGNHTDLEIYRLGVAELARRRRPLRPTPGDVGGRHTPVHRVRPDQPDPDGLVAADCLTCQPRWPRGLLVGIAAAIKLTPAAFVLFFLLRRDYRAALDTCSAADRLQLRTAHGRPAGGVVLAVFPDTVRRAPPRIKLGRSWASGPTSVVGSAEFRAATDCHLVLRLGTVMLSNRPTTTDEEPPVSGPPEPPSRGEPDV